MLTVDFDKVDQGSRRQYKKDKQLPHYLATTTSRRLIVHAMAMMNR